MREVENGSGGQLGEECFEDGRMEGEDSLEFGGFAV
jgi:hypothetical protein